MGDVSRHEPRPSSIIRHSMGCRPETLCGPMLSSLFTLQNSLWHRRTQPTRHEEGAERGGRGGGGGGGGSAPLSWQPRLSSKARTHTAKAGCHE